MPGFFFSAMVSPKRAHFFDVHRVQPAWIAGFLMVILAGTASQAAEDAVFQPWVIAQINNQSRNLSPAEADQLMIQAAELFAKADYSSAIALWSRIINAPPSKDVLNQALVGRAKSYLILSQPGLAIADLERCQYQPRQIMEIGELWLLKGTTYLQLNKPADAITKLTQAEKFLPNEASLYSNRGIAEQMVGNLTKARSDLKKSISLKPSMSSYYNLAVLELAAGNYQACHSILSQIVAKNPPYAPVFVQRGQCAALQGNHEESISDMLKALKLDPNNVSAIQQLGISLAAKGEVLPARQALEKAAAMRLAAGQIEEYQKILSIMSSVSKKP